MLKVGFPAAQKVHFPDSRLDGSSIDLQTAGLQFFLNVLILAGSPARTVDLLSRKDQYADGGQQVFLLLSIGPCLQPGDDAQGDPAGEERDLRL